MVARDGMDLVGPKWRGRERGARARKVSQFVGVLESQSVMKTVQAVCMEQGAGGPPPRAATPPPFVKCMRRSEMGERRRKWVSVSEGRVVLDDPLPEVYGDWGVCRALGWRRRKLVAFRKTLRRGVDWDVREGEVGMTGAWCRARGLDVKSLAPAGGVVSMEVVGFVANRQLVLGRAIGAGVVGPVRVRDAGDFRRGDVFEVSGGRIVGPWPRRDW